MVLAERVRSDAEGFHDVAIDFRADVSLSLVEFELVGCGYRLSSSARLGKRPSALSSPEVADSGCCVAGVDAIVGGVKAPKPGKAGLCVTGVLAALADSEPEIA